ncbi:MAG: glycosyltransferase, partial [Gemmatimonadales bacterium]
MRVVWVTHNYPRYPGDPAGAFLHPLALALRARDVDVQVVAPSDAGQGGDAELDGVPVTRVRYASARSETLGYGGMAGVRRLPGGLLILNRLRRSLRAGARGLLDTGGEVLVHAHWWLPAGLAAPAEVPLVLTCHGTDVRMLERAPLLARVARPVFRRARVVTTVSRVLAETIRRITGVGVAPDAV